ncbi:MAG TPA: sigma 54-interacting transcriptional regulator [Kofleriaceae bacterium]
MRQHERNTTIGEAYVEPPPGDSWFLIVSTGEDTSRVVPFPEGTELVFGREDDCQIHIEHDAVSRRHAILRRRGDDVTIEDLSSRNGTLVNGQTVTGTKRIAIGDVIQVGPGSAIVASSSAVRASRTIHTSTELEDRFAAEVDRAARYHRPLGLVMLRIEGPTEAMTDHVEGFAANLRRMDLLAEYGSDELAIVLPETDRDATRAVSNRAKVVPEGLQASAGFATYPEDGSSFGELISVARDRLRGIDRATRPGQEGAQPIIVDPMMKQVMVLAGRVAASPIPVLVRGETGVGKEIVAEFIHRSSPRKRSQFIRFNCASLSEQIVESELFGHDKGAFDGATQAKPGFFEVAQGGTLFLDEIGELPLNTQAKLLRAIETKRISRLGASQETPVDVRLICATPRDLAIEVRRGRFREDLYFRISSFVIPVPPLRDRKAEIGPLAAHFASELAPHGTAPTVTPEALRVLEAHDWPGNVRELRNAIERALVLSGGAPIEPHHLPERLLERIAISSTEAPAIDVRQRVADVERTSVLDALDSTKGNQTKAAKKLGISRFALIRLMEKHDLKKKP